MYLKVQKLEKDINKFDSQAQNSLHTRLLVLMSNV